MKERLQAAAKIALCLAVPLALFCFAFQSTSALGVELPRYLPLSFTVLPLLYALVCRKKVESAPWLIASLFFFAATTARQADYAFLNGLTLRWLGVFAILGWIAIRYVTAAVLPTLVGIAGATSLAGFLHLSGGDLIFSDDHPSFLYRIIQLRDHFPGIPFYNPQWNAGVEAREFFPSGALGPFFLFAPLWYLFEPDAVYTLAVGVLLFAIVPLLAYGAGRALQFTGAEAGVAALLTLTSSLFWYRYALSYGTLGFVVSASFLPATIALSVRLVLEGRTATTQTIVAWAVCLSFTVFWPLFIVCLVPVALTFLVNARRLVTNRKLLVALGVLFLVHVPWMLLFVQASRVGSFVVGPSAGAGRVVAASEIVVRLRELVHSSNPLILCAAPFAFWSCGSSLVSLSALLLLLLWFVGPFLAPHLELERFFLLFLGVAALPVARYLVAILQGIRSGSLRGGGSLARQGISALIAGLLFYLSLWSWKVARNESRQPFVFAAPYVKDVVATIGREGGEGRTLIMGFILHELSEGHVAPLTWLTKKPMIASRYQHDRWQFVDVLPDEFRKEGPAGVFRFLELMNVSALVTHDRSWSQWVRQRPESFEQAGFFNRFRVFKVKKFSSNYFLAGSGEVLQQAGNRIRLRIDGTEAIIKFNYFPFLRASGCMLSPHAASESITFIKLTDCRPGQEIEVSAVSPVQRLFGRVQ